jgi:FkbM family methyltransferase
MNFVDENNNLIDTNSFEKSEQDLAQEYIINSDVVLELGARYGTVSCIINKILWNTSGQVVVEPDERVWDALEKNRANNNCNFHIIKGFISNRKMDLVNKDYGYGTTSSFSDNSSIPYYTLNEVENMYNLKFNVLVADCEGFLEIFLDENPQLYNQLRMIIFEADYPDKCNYDKIKQNLLNNNFGNKLDGFQNVWIKIPHDFNVDIYRLSLTSDYTNEQCITHYINHGHKEHRVYK